MIVYFRYKYRGLRQRIEQDIPVGFNAMPFGFQASNRNWMYFLGGPYVIYTLFFILAVIVICIPSDISSLLCSQLCDTNESKLLQSLNHVTIEELGGVEFTSLDVGWSTFTTAMRARLYMLINPKFWELFLDTWILRLRGLVRRKPKCFPKCVFFIMLFPLFLVTVIAVIFDLGACIIVYGVPILFLTKCLFANYIKYCVDRFIWKRVNKQKVFSNCILVWTSKILIFLVLSYILFCYYTIYTHSMTYIYQTISFTFIGIVAFPSESITYIIMFTAIFLYVLKVIKHINAGYIDLLYQTIHISENIQESKQADTTVVYIVHCENIPGVYRHVFDHLVEKYRPLRVQLFLCCVYL
ncbi:unnamed protein product, partial [Owenia fusiformis]